MERSSISSQKSLPHQSSKDLFDDSISLTVPVTNEAEIESNSIPPTSRIYSVSTPINSSKPTSSSKTPKTPTPPSTVSSSVSSPRSRLPTASSHRISSSSSPSLVNSRPLTTEEHFPTPDPSVDEDPIFNDVESETESEIDSESESVPVRMPLSLHVLEESHPISLTMKHQKDALEESIKDLECQIRKNAAAISIQTIVRSFLAKICLKKAKRRVNVFLKVTEKARDLLIEQTIIYFAMQVSFQCMEEKAAEEEEKLRELKEAELREAELARIAEEERSLTAQIKILMEYIYENALDSLVEDEVKSYIRSLFATFSLPLSNNKPVEEKKPDPEELLELFLIDCLVKELALPIVDDAIEEEVDEYFKNKTSP